MKPTVCWMSLGGTMGFSGANKHGWSLTMGCNWNGPGVALELYIYIYLLDNWWWLGGLIGIFLGFIHGGLVVHEWMIPWYPETPHQPLLERLLELLSTWARSTSRDIFPSADFILLKIIITIWLFNSSPWKIHPFLRTVFTIYFDLGHRKTMANC